MKTVEIGPAAVDAGLWAIRYYLMQRYGVDESARDIAPLSWYIHTGRATPDFIRAVFIAKPYMIGRKLHMGGTYDEVINRIKDYTGYTTDLVQ